MAAIPCKLCGASLLPAEGTSVVECEVCGGRQTVPSADSEKMLTLFGRAHRLRASCEFDKAASVYGSIAAEFPTEAEAYWDLVLCKYGVAYADDPVTGKKIPACHRASFDSVMDDDSFEQVMENADPIARSVYREEAKQIEELRKGIIELAGKEEPYDIFICYKETAADGGRTLDSVIAQDVYDALTEKGYRVFFARITLEDKLGQEYEPYIFAALNSAKILLAFGTDYEYYNAVWVKNEWSRFLQLIAKGEKKTLIPCYKGLDAYDMPKEFAKLQAQDMGKVGAIQDLLRGIEKLLPRDAGKEKDLDQQAGAVDSLLKRMQMCLEDGEWDSAKEYCNRILDIDPENAEANVGLLRAKLHAYREQDLGTGEIDLSNFKSFGRALQFASSERKAVLEQYQKATAAREEKKKRIEEEKRQKWLREVEEKQREVEEKKRIAEEKRLALETLRKRSEAASKLISCGTYHTVGIQSNETTVSAGVITGELNHGQCNVSDWRNIVAIACSHIHTVGLKSDGTVVATGKNDYGQCNVTGWRDIVAIACDYNETVGLKSDGTVVTTNCASGKSDWRDIIAIARSNCDTLGLKADGTVITDQYSFKVNDWCDIVAIACSNRHAVGLKADGTVVAERTTGVDRFFDPCYVFDWCDIIAIACGSFHTVGLKTDGTVVATDVYGKENNHGQSNVSGWRDIIAIACSPIHTVGLKVDGTVVATGRNGGGQCNVSGWRLFHDFDHLEDERKTETERRKAEDARIEAERARQREKEQQQRNRRTMGLCQHCGGQFKGLFSKKCSACGKPKDY